MGEPIVPPEWQIFTEGTLNIATANRVISTTRPSALNIPFTYPGTNQMIWYLPSGAQFFKFDEACIIMNVQISSANGSFTAFAAGTPISLKPQIAAFLMDQIRFQYGSVDISAPPPRFGKAVYVSQIVEQSADWIGIPGLMGQQGYDDTIVIPDTGQTQNTSGQQYQAPMCTVNSTLNIIDVTTPAATGLTLILGTVGTSAAILNVKGTGIVTGDVITISYNGPGITTTGPVTVTAMSATRKIASFKLGTVAAGIAPLNLVSAAATTTGEAAAITVGTKQLSFYDTQNAGYAIPLVATITTGATTSTITLTGSAGAVAATDIPVATGDAVTVDFFNTVAWQQNSSKFWHLQNMTDNGRVLTLRLRLSDWVDFFKQFKKPLIGSNAQFVMVTPPTTGTASTWGPVTTAQGYLWITDDLFEVPILTPSPPLAKMLERQLAPGNYFDFNVEKIYNQFINTIQTTSTTFAIQQALTEDVLQWAVAVFTPSSYSGVQVSNENCSIVPQNTSTAGTFNPVSKAYLQLNGISYPPDLPYGTLVSDIKRQWQSFLDLCGRNDPELLAPALPFPKWLQDHFFLVWDLRDRPQAIAEKQDNTVSPNLTFVNSFTQNTDVNLVVFQRQDCRFTVTPSKAMSFSKLSSAEVFPRYKGLEQSMPPGANG